jgi:FRG domain
MQHCGTPTRLLDWTEGALIAFHFAVRNKSDKADAAVWALNPWELNKSVLGIDEVIAPSAEAGLFDLDAKRYDPRLPARYQSRKLRVKLPVAIYTTHFARRISPQRSRSLLDLHTAGRGAQNMSCQNFDSRAHSDPARIC